MAHNPASIFPCTWLVEGFLTFHLNLRLSAADEFDLDISVWESFLEAHISGFLLFPCMRGSILTRHRSVEYKNRFIKSLYIIYQGVYV